MWLHSSQFLIATAIFHFAFSILHFFDHIHFFGFYIGNYPALEPEKIDALCKILNAV